jgi:hypothetical protein
MIKTYTYEIGYENDYFQPQNYSIAQQLPNIITNLHNKIIELQ